QRALSLGFRRSCSHHCFDTLLLPWRTAVPSILGVLDITYQLLLCVFFVSVCLHGNAVLAHHSMRTPMRRPRGPEASRTAGPPTALITPPFLAPVAST